MNPPPSPCPAHPPHLPVPLPLGGGRPLRRQRSGPGVPLHLPGHQRSGGELLAPAPGAVPEAGSPRRELLLPLVLSVVALLLLLTSACAQLDPAAAGSTDAGVPPAVASIDPAPGAVLAPAELRLAFTEPMDASLLLSDVDRSETVILVPQAQAEVMAAALVHARLTARERGLLVPSRVVLNDDASNLALSLDAPLAPGDYALLLSPRLRSADRRKLTGTLRFVYQVRAQPPRPTLIAPLAGGTAPKNLRQVRLDLPEAHAGVVLALTAGDKLVAAAVAPDASGPAAIDLCPGGRCAALLAGQAYSVLLDGKPVEGAKFTIAGCVRADAPSVRTQALTAKAAGADLALALDWPAQVTVEWAPLPAEAPVGDDDAALAHLCAAGSCGQSTAAALCAPAACDGVPLEAPCSASMLLGPLAGAGTWLWRAAIADDEGHVTTLPAARFSTLAEAPAASIDEVMASPPGPAPRGDGEYVEILNPGPGAVDAGRLALVGPDGKVRPLLGAPPTAPLYLQPGQRALAVGAGFDPGRYSLPAGTVLLRAGTQRLLGRGLTDDGSQAFVLLFLPGPLGAGAGSTPGPLEISRFPGEGPVCPAGASLERISPPPKPGGPLFRCGAAGGSPGRAP